MGFRKKIRPVSVGQCYEGMFPTHASCLPALHALLWSLHSPRTFTLICASTAAVVEEGAWAIVHGSQRFMPPFQTFHWPLYVTCLSLTAKGEGNGLDVKSTMAVMQNEDIKLIFKVR